MLVNIRSRTYADLIELRTGITKIIREHRKGLRRLEPKMLASFMGDRDQICTEIQRRRMARLRRVRNTRIEVVRVQSAYQRYVAEVRQNGKPIFSGPEHEARQFASQARKRLESMEVL